MIDPQVSIHLPGKTRRRIEELARKRGIGVEEMYETLIDLGLHSDLWPEEMSPAVASLYTNYSAAYLRKLKSAEVISAIKEGNKKQSRILFRRSDLDAYLISQGKRRGGD